MTHKKMTPLRRRRIAAQLSQQALAQLAGLSIATIAAADRWGAVSPVTADRCARALGCKAADLLPQD